MGSKGAIGGQVWGGETLVPKVRGGWGTGKEPEGKRATWVERNWLHGEQTAKGSAGLRGGWVEGWWALSYWRRGGSSP